MNILPVRKIVALMFVGVALCACLAPPQPAKPSSEKTDSAAAKVSEATATPAMMSISSSAFPDGARIPVTYTCKGKNISPPLAWTDAPKGTGSYALILEDPDTARGTLTHWIVFNIPYDSNSLSEAVPDQAHSFAAFSQGNNSFGKTGYDGPCPPSGQSHRYIFSLYALDTVLSQLKAGVSKSEILDATQGHVLGFARLTGIFNQ